MGVSSRHGTIAIAVQTGKGVPAAVPVRKYYFREGPSIAPIKERARLPRTDSGRDQGPAYTSAMRVEGDIPVYLHPDGASMLFAAALGSVGHAGAGPNYTHTITPGNDALWLTIWKMAGLTVLEEYQDCKIVSMRIESSAGGPVLATLSIVGIRSEFEAADTGLAPLESDPYLHMEALARHKIGGAALPMDTVAWELGNGTSAWQADDYHPSDIDPGGREVSVNFGTRFQSPTIEPKYREHFYSSDAGTTQSPAAVTKAWEIEYYRDANTSVKIACPEITYGAVPVQPDPSGEPIGMAVSAAVEKPAGGNICTVTVKDQNPTH